MHGERVDRMHCKQRLPERTLERARARVHTPHNLVSVLNPRQSTFSLFFNVTADFEVPKVILRLARKI